MNLRQLMEWSVLHESERPLASHDEARVWKEGSRSRTKAVRGQLSLATMVQIQLQGVREF